MYFYVARLFLKYVEILQQIENNIRVKQSFDASEENTAWRQEDKKTEDERKHQRIWNLFKIYLNYEIFLTYHPKPTHLKKFLRK